MNYVGAARTNYFKVKDEEAFAELAVAAGAFVEHEEGRVALFWDDAFSDFILIEMEDEYGHWEEEVDFLSTFAPHLADGEVAIIQGIGHEGLRFVNGFAIAVTNASDPVYVGLNDIYDKAAAKFGVEAGSISTAEY